jgi:hypothetical protein
MSLVLPKDVEYTISSIAAQDRMSRITKHDASLSRIVEKKPMK